MPGFRSPEDRAREKDMICLVKWHGYCKDCKWWMTDPPGLQSDTGLWGDCGVAGNGGGQPLVPQTKAWAYDSHNYAAGLNTREDFGCVQWKERNGV